MNRKSALSLCLCLISFWAVGQKLIVETDFIGNRHFIVYEKQVPLPVDYVNGEDFKSKKYAPHFYTKLAKKYPEWKDEITIARSEVDIDLKILNGTSTSWRIDNIWLVPITNVDLESSFLKTGEWPYSTRAEEDEIMFKISGSSRSTNNVVRDIVVPKNRSKELNINVKVASPLASTSKIISFKFKIKLIEIGGDSSKVLETNKVFYVYTHRQ